MRVRPDFRPQVPDAFKRMMRGVDQNAEQFIGQPENIALIAVIHSRREDRRTVKDFADELLSEPRSFDDLWRIWFSTPVEIPPADTQDREELRRHMLMFFKHLSEEIGRREAPGAH